MGPLLGVGPTATISDAPLLTLGQYLLADLSILSVRIGEPVAGGHEKAVVDVSRIPKTRLFVAGWKPSESCVAFTAN